MFVHGFGGNAAATWGRFPEFLARNPQLRGWDIHSVGYPTSLRIDIPHVWAAEPDLATLALELVTVLEHPPFKGYGSVALVAHSMGGLIVQKALLTVAIARRVSHVVLFGTPSAGLGKATPGSRLKRQARDMAEDSAFITTLRLAWGQAYPSATPFRLRVVAGDLDEFVTRASSLEPFPDVVRAVVPGNHLGIVKPSDPGALSVSVVEELLLPKIPVRGAIDSARLAVEEREFASAIRVLLPRANALDEAALVQLALALESVGRGDEALRLLERRYRDGTTWLDALGVLAGRLKRRWMVERDGSDWKRAHDLYEIALAKAEELGDADQAMYHAVNVAFLELMIVPTASSVPLAAREMARRALAHSESAGRGHWRFATEGEAHAILCDFAAAHASYRQAVAASPPGREVESIYVQAISVVARVFGAAEQRQIETLFRTALETG